MLRRINAALFEAPAGARIEIVAESQNNNGVTDARFEYDGALLDREQILGLPGCSFTVAETHARLQAVVAFADSAPGTARYDLSEVENGVLSNLNKFTLKSDASPLIDFVIDPVEQAVAAPARRAPARRAAKGPRRKAPAKRATTKPTKKSRAKTGRRSRKTTASRRSSSRRRR